MIKNRAFSIFAVAALVGIAACSPGEEEAVVDEGMTATDTTMFTETETQMAPVVAPVTTTDTGLVVTETEVDVDRDVDVDTVRRP